MHADFDQPKSLFRGCGESSSRIPTALEQEIDRLVYALYGLTKDEIKPVEEAAKRR